MKNGEIGYLKAIGPEGRRHAEHKPFSDPRCGSYLIAMGQIIGLMPPPPKRVLDLGCGTGWTSRMLAKRGYSVVGMGISPDMIESACAAPNDGSIGDLAFHVGDYEQVDGNAQFDIVLFFDSLHHAENERAGLACAFRALGDGGVCIASEPGKGHSRTQASVSAVQRFKVNEKDMPPEVV